MRQDKRETGWYSLADRRDRADARKLWEEIFPEDSESFLNYYDQWKASRNRMETRRRSGQLISMIQWNPYRIHMGDRTEDSYYVIAVATKPEFRHRGLMAGQLRDGFRKFREEGVPFLFLMPADPAIYEPFDFRYIYDRAVMTVPGYSAAEGDGPECGKSAAEGYGSEYGKSAAGGEAPADDPSGSCGSLTVRPLTPGEWETAASFSEERLADHFRVYAVRDAEYVERSAWECRSEGGDAEGIFRDGCLAGTFSWWWESDTVIGIREMILLPEYETKAGLAQLRAALAARWPEAEEIRVIMAADGDTYQREPIIMGRILDLPEFLKGFTCPETVRTLLTVGDRYIPDNNGTFLWTMGPEGSVLEELTEAPGDGSREKTLTEKTAAEHIPEGMGEIRADIADLLLWLTGQGTPDSWDGIRMTAEGRNFAEVVEPLRGVFFPEIV